MTDQGTAAVSLRRASKRFGGAVALAPTTLDLPAGQTTVLLGPSGCGKSTLLRLINGLIAPDEGTVTVLGESPADPRRVEALRRRMGYVIQEGGLFPHLTARANATLLARWCGWPRERIAARLDELSELARLPSDLLDRRPSELSGGQRQRAALVRALMLDPELLLLDEPLGALDPLVRAELQADLREAFRALGKTVVMVTHDLGEAAHFGDHVVLLREGHVVQAGPLAALEHHPADPFVTRFLTAQRSLWAPGAP
ncbi:MAG: ATP-binding cassette domain-containing protein [Myxococcales bacterium]|nr:MAG: ATP-binding cassette domain-containing protein [Myxococcales bacterium]